MTLGNNNITYISAGMHGSSIGVDAHSPHSPPPPRQALGAGGILPLARMRGNCWVFLLAYNKVDNMVEVLLGHALYTFRKVRDLEGKYHSYSRACSSLSNPCKLADGTVVFATELQLPPRTSKRLVQC